MAAKVIVTAPTLSAVAFATVIVSYLAIAHNPSFLFSFFFLISRSKEFHFSSRTLTGISTQRQIQGSGSLHSFGSSSDTRWLSSDLVPHSNQHLATPSCKGIHSNFSASIWTKGRKKRDRCVVSFPM